MKKFRPSYLIFWICLVITSFYFLSGVSSFYPLNPWDEAFYIMLAQKPLALTPLDFPALYVGFLKFLKLFAQSPEELYFLNIKIQTLGLSLLVYLTGVRLRLQPLFCFIAAYLILISNLNAPIVFSKTNHLNACFFLCAFLLATWIPNRFWKYYFLGFAILISLYLRIENAVLLPLFILYILLRHGRERLRQSFFLLGLLSFSYGTLYFAFRPPLGGERIWWAFADWYYWKQNVRSSLFETEMIVSQRAAVIRYMQEVFGNSSHLLQAALANPIAFIENLAGNLLAWLINLPIWLTGHFPLSPSGFFTDSKIQGAIEILLGAGVLFLLAKFSEDHKSPELESIESPQHLEIFFLLTAALLMKGLFLSALLSAAPRYSLEFVVFTTLFFFWFLQFRKNWQVRARDGLLFVLILFLLTPSHQNQKLKEFYIKPGDVYYGQTIRILKTLQARHPLRILCSTPVDTYMGQDERSYTAADFLMSTAENPDLNEYLEMHHINAVVIDKKIGMRFSETSRMPSLERFLAAAESKGFVALIRAPYQKDWPFVLLVKKDILDSQWEF